MIIVLFAIFSARSPYAQIGISPGDVPVAPKGRALRHPSGSQGKVLQPLPHRRGFTCRQRRHKIKRALFTKPLFSCNFGIVPVLCVCLVHERRIRIFIRHPGGFHHFDCFKRNADDQDYARSTNAHS